MDSRIVVVQDRKRGCGWREKGGKYLVADGLSFYCGLLPLSLHNCECCGMSYKSRAPKMVLTEPLLKRSVNASCAAASCMDNDGHICPFAWEIHLLEQQANAELPDEKQLIFGERVCLIRVGKKFYKKPIDFTREAALQGISRRINNVPRGFKVGETWVMLAHEKVKLNDVEIGATDDEIDEAYGYGVFSMFKPKRIEVICDGTESTEEIDDYIDKGFTPVYIERIGEEPVQERLSIDQ